VIVQKQGTAAPKSTNPHNPESPQLSGFLILMHCQSPLKDLKDLKDLKTLLDHKALKTLKALF